MAKFKVEIESLVRRRNPFRPIHLSLDDKSTYLIRSWEIEAKNEAEARRLFKEAQDKKLPNVIGFTLRSIVKVPVDRSIEK